MKRLIAECILEDLQQETGETNCRIRVSLDDPIAPRLTIGLECVLNEPLPGTGTLPFFVPLVDLLFCDSYVSVLHLRTPDKPYPVEYCNPEMIDIIYHEIVSTILEAYGAIDQRVKPTSIPDCAAVRAGVWPH